MVTGIARGPSLLLRPEEAETRARRIRVLLTDCDGVLTDGGVYYSAAGESLRRFSVRDGMGVERLRDDSIATAILTGEDSANIARRASKLRLPFLYMGKRDKLAELPSISEDTGAPLDALAYIGDDVNDLAILERIGEAGLTAAPADAQPEVLAQVHYRCVARGGFGAFREFAEWVLALRRRRGFSIAGGRSS